jgi:hypothetical protein
VASGSPLLFLTAKRPIDAFAPVIETQAVLCISASEAFRHSQGLVQLSRLPCSDCEATTSKLRKILPSVEYSFFHMAY